MSAWVYDDGGRASAGFRGEAGDCVTRAIAIASETDYLLVYNDISDRMTEIGKPRSARNGIPKKVYKPYINNDMGWLWTPCMFIGSGTQIHLRPDELPGGRLIVAVSKHMVAMVDGVIHDTHDPSRDGTRCVYGYWVHPAC